MNPLIEYAGFWRRAAAAVLDLMLFSAFIALLQLPGYTMLGQVVQFSVGLLLCVFLWMQFQGTPGKLLMGCCVVQAGSHKPLGLKQSLLRYLGYYVSQLVLFLGFFWVLWDRKKQGFHDKMANSVVLVSANIGADDESQKSLQQLMAELR